MCSSFKDGKYSERAVCEWARDFHLLKKLLVQIPQVYLPSTAYVRCNPALVPAHNTSLLLAGPLLLNSCVYCFTYDIFLGLRVYVSINFTFLKDIKKKGILDSAHPHTVHPPQNRNKMRIPIRVSHHGNKTPTTAVNCQHKCCHPGNGSLLYIHCAFPQEC